MTKIIIKLGINVLALLVVDYILPGFELDGLGAAVVTAIIIGVINTFIRPILQIIALPISILTLGIFAFLINVALLLATSLIVPGFEIDGFLTAAIASILLTLTTMFLQKLSSNANKGW